MAEQVTEQLSSLEAKIGRTLGDPANPLLVSVRSGAKFSMPGMMETVLNIGMSDASVAGLTEFSQDERFAWDSYRRLIQMFGKTVLDIEGHYFEHAIDQAKTDAGVATDVELGVPELQALVATYKGIVKEHAGIDFPQDPREQLDRAIKAVFDSWNTDRAKLYRRQERIPSDLGTAVNVQAMVFGNVGDDSGTGVAFTRDPATGATGHYGDYLPDAQGEDVVSGVRNTLTLDDMGRLDPEAHAQLLANMDALEAHYKDLCDIEFTVERGQLYMLQTRVRQAHRRCGLPDRDPAGRRGRHRHGRGRAPRLRRPARAADVPALRPLGRSQDRGQGHRGLPGRGRRHSGVRLRDRRGQGRARASRRS